MQKKNCECFEPCYSNKKWLSELQIHSDNQDRSSEAWLNFLELIKQAVSDKREVFDPKKDLGTEDWLSIETLPPEIAQLKSVKQFILYGSNLTWIPPEIGDMDSLEEFIPYKSYRLHWFPYEITKCKHLSKSTISTRALYGNYKYRPPFPHLRGNPISLYKNRATCNICGASSTTRDLNQVWISIKVAADVLPLLAHTCSLQCLMQLPEGASGYIKKTHKGGLGMAQPTRFI